MKKVLSIMLCLVLAISCMAAATVSASADAKPRYIVLVLDVSSSMDSYGEDSDMSRLESEKLAAVRFCEQATKNVKNKVAIVTFGSDSNVVCKFTNDITALQVAINEIETDGSTNVYEAFYTANELLNNEETGGIDFERNIVFCSDGTPLGGPCVTEYKYTSDDYIWYDNANAVLKYVDENVKPTTNVYTIGFFQGLYGLDATFAPIFMADLANKMSVVTDNADELIDTFENFADEITEEPVATPDTPEAPVVNNNGNTNNTTTTQNNAAAAAAAQAIRTGVAMPTVVLGATTLGALGFVILTMKKKASDEK